MAPSARRAAIVPHQLVMTATPIPRTLAMAAYADLDVSAIDELPPGRTPVQTVALSAERRPELVERIRAACAEGRQAYWVCTLIDESDEVVAQAAQGTFEALSAQLPRLRVGLVHGRMKAAEKQATMRAFKDGDIDLLVATTVIEVGVDVPNASLMIIENAERLGLAQLHQLRGRVGRGSAASSCVLLYRSPLSMMARQRLETMRETNDGFVIAEKDLRAARPRRVAGHAPDRPGRIPRRRPRPRRRPAAAGAASLASGCWPNRPRSPSASSRAGSAARRATPAHDNRLPLSEPMARRCRLYGDRFQDRKPR